MPYRPSSPLQPLLSIITINLNNYTGLSRTIDSLLPLSSHHAIECIFIDGLSSDSSLTLAQSSNVFAQVISQLDTGIYDAMNKGGRLAHGKYLLWLNSGDELSPSIQPSILISDLHSLNYDLIVFPLYLASSLTRSNPVSYKSIAPSDMIASLPRGTLPHPSTLVLKQTFLNLGGYNTSYKIAGDRDFFIRAFLSSKSIHTLPYPLSIFYPGGLSTTRRVHIDNLLINYRNGLISFPCFLFCYAKYLLGTFSLYLSNLPGRFRI